MFDPANDLIALKKTCKELQKVLAFGQADAEEVDRLAEDVKYLGLRLSVWAKNQSWRR